MNAGARGNFTGIELGRCRLGAPLGRGAVGTVYRARQVALERDVAIKLVVVGHGATATAERFEREARVVAAIEHPHVIPVYDAGEADGVLYLVMRLVEGRDLGALLAGGPLAPERAVALLGQVAGALDAAHRADVLHRDVKPTNVLVEATAGEHAGRPIRRSPRRSTSASRRSRRTCARCSTPSASAGSRRTRSARRSPTAPCGQAP